MGVKFGYITDVHKNLGTAQSLWNPVGPFDAQYRQYSTADARLQEFASDMEVAGAGFCVQGGDLTDANTNSRYSDLSDAICITDTYYSSDFWHTVGNHEGLVVWLNDISDMWTQLDTAANAGIRENEWNPASDITGPLAYTFDKNGIRFVVLYADGGILDSPAGAGERNWLTSKALNTDKPVVIFTHALLRPVDYSYAVVDDYIAVNSDLVAAGNVQLVIQGHFHRNQIEDFTDHWETHSDIIYFYGRGSILGAEDGDSGDTATTADSAYYLFDVIPNAYIGDNQMRANVTVTAFRKGKNKPQDTFALI